MGVVPIEVEEGCYYIQVVNCCLKWSREMEIGQNPFGLLHCKVASIKFNFDNNAENRRIWGNLCKRGFVVNGKEDKAGRRQIMARMVKFSDKAFFWNHLLSLFQNRFFRLPFKKETAPLSDRQIMGLVWNVQQIKFKFLFCEIAHLKREPSVSMKIKFLVAGNWK